MNLTSKSAHLSLCCDNIKIRGIAYSIRLTPSALIQKGIAGKSTYAGNWPVEKTILKISTANQLEK